MYRTIQGWLAAVLTLALFPVPAVAATVDGVELPDTLSVEDTTLVLNGAGSRSKWFIDLYVAGLYLPGREQDATAIVAADEPQAIHLHITSGMITSERLMEATQEGFENSTGGNLAPIQDDIDASMDVFSEEIGKGDVFTLIYVPDEGVRMLKNGELRDTVGDLEFKRALFGIWLSDKPAQGSLKRDMLGQ